MFMVGGTGEGLIHCYMALRALLDGGWSTWAPLIQRGMVMEISAGD